LVLLVAVSFAVSVSAARAADQASSVSAGDVHSCAVLADKTVNCWGRNALGQLGNGTTTDSPVPLPVSVSGITDALSVSAGNVHSCAVLAGKTVKEAAARIGDRFG